MPIGDWDEGTLARFIEDVLDRSATAGLARAMGMAGMRVVCGTVAGATGAVLRGAGFTATRTAAGRYTITFTPAFSAVPSAVMLGAMAGTATNFVAEATGVTAAQAFMVIQNTGVAFVDVDFSFIAIGPA